MNLTRTFVVPSLLALAVLPSCKKKDKARDGTPSVAAGSDTAANAKPTTPTTPPTPPTPPAAKTLPGTAVGPCPAASKVTEVTSKMDGFAATQPIDWSTIKTSKALLGGGGSKLYVYLSNADVSGPDLGRIVLKVPLTEKGTGILNISFTTRANPVKLGKYERKDGVGADLYAPTGEKGNDFILSASAGSATILDAKDGKVCGTFDLTGDGVSVKGEFVADLLDEYGK